MTISPGTVVSIHRVLRNGGPAEALTAIAVITDFGLQGDYRSRPDSPRQVTIIAEETLLDIHRTLGHDTANGASRRQVVVRGVDLQSLLGREFRIGSIALRGERDCHPCDRMESTIGPGARDALKERGGLTCRVLSGGLLRIGDPVAPDPG